MPKTVLITGTSSGFGNDVAKTLAAAGHRVFATMRDPHKRHREVAKDFQSKGIETIELDVTDDASVDAAFKLLADIAGVGLDVLVNNAGVAAGGLTESFTPEQLREMFDVNVFGIQRTMRAALPQMRKAKSGLVINIGSVLGRLTIPFVGLFGASKFAVEALTDSYRYELSQFGIDVLLIQPGPFPTKLYADLRPPADGGRAGDYGEVAAFPGIVSKVLEHIFTGANAPNPHDVAEAIDKLIDTPAGRRPHRVVVGLAFGADTANSAIEPLQSQIVSSFGLGHLAKLNIR
ncbi:SDR family oxidoreductase [Bradyrhizobium sp. NAS96.2]|uniref:SDR family oxidoreductase n=1 Tax=Bradyrhizobium sp. NAS96.2 TaxID=1680160 RepID=UPI000938FB83|nr:SDR family oxidoreductase [Bradyrhizobium sp. NAS96.2]OKO75618.1 17-beta-hydroxysteroid dehydrogenase [Bradyrhizobium sp. NAS96.2]